MGNGGVQVVITNTNRLEKKRRTARPYIIHNIWAK